jgi:hypothetical protein
MRRIVIYAVYRIPVTRKIMVDRMGGLCVIHIEEAGKGQRILVPKQKGRNNLKNLDTDARIIIKKDQNRLRDCRMESPGSG